MIEKEKIKPLFESKYIKVFDLEYAPGKHYYDATRREVSDLVAAKTTEEVKKMLPDAVSCVVILKTASDEEKLLLMREYRYPVGQYLLSVPAGLIDPADRMEKEPYFAAAKRELQEETGITFEKDDEISVINSCLYSTPGMTDESNALVKIVLNRSSMPKLTQDGAVGSENFDGFVLLDKKEAKKILTDGRDENGIFYSVYTFMALMCFLTDI